MKSPAGGRTLWATSLAAVALVLATAFPLWGQSRSAVSWGPSREEAVLATQDDAVGTGIEQADAYVEELPPGRTLRVQRPARLSPRAGVVRMHEQYVEGPTVIEELPVPNGMPGEHLGVGGECAACCGDGCVNCCGNWNSCGPVSPCCLLPRPRLDPLEVLLGVQGFTGPANRGASGSFGFYQGFNHALSLCDEIACVQFGARWTENNFDGSVLTTENRNQVFLTTGLFRRCDWGLQGGVVFDYLHDEWDYEVDLAQVRGEVGWKFECRHEIGFRFSAGTSDDDATISEAVLDDGDLVIRERDARFEVNDLYALYYRRQFQCGGEGRLFGGFTNSDQGLVGGDVRVPLNPCWSLQADFLYLVPADDSAAGFAEESWNVAVGVVWTPFARPGCPVYCRPLLDVANNGTFVTRLD